MVDYETESLGVGCVLILKVRGKHEGELTIEELEEIDEVMEYIEIGNNLSTRTGVTTTKAEKGVTVEYAVQTSVSHRRIKNYVDRLEAFTVLEDPAIFVDVATAEFVERKKDG